MFGRDPDQRIAKATRWLAEGRHNDVRLEMEGLDLPEAQSLRDQALTALAQMNLDEAQARFSSDDPDGAKESLDLAILFGADKDQVRTIRKAAREARKAARTAAEAEANTPPTPVGDDPLWSLPPDDPRIRFALAMEAYPDAIRPRMLELGREFAEAVLSIEKDPAAARARLGSFVETDPVARYERARAALAAGQLPAAASDLATFGEEVGHMRIGQNHTGVMHAQVLTQLGRGEEALAMLDVELAKRNDIALAGTRISVLEVLGRLEEAEKSGSRLLRDASRDMGLIRLVARCRERLGNRMGAAAMLEDGLTRCCSSPGKCGNQAYDVPAARMLTRIYLEDRIQEKRVTTLVAELERWRKQETWEDGYIAALLARNAGRPDADRFRAALATALPAADPRHAWLDLHLPSS
jgi:tetratricopeptide (TPR) repeat protein